MQPHDEVETPFRRSAAILVFASIVFCAPLFLNLENLGREDWDQFTFRYDTPRVSLLRDEVLPTWNPYANGGTVLLAHPDSPVLSPWYAIVLALGAPIGLRVQVVVFMAIGAIGMAAFVGRLGARTAGRIAAGVTFMMSSHFALHMAEGHLEWCVLGLMPWVAWCVLRAGSGIRFLILGAMLLASAMTFGAVYIPAVFLPFLSVWVLGLAIARRNWRLPLWWSGLVVVAVLLSSIKLLPTLAFTADWPRIADADQYTPPAVLAAGLLHPQQAFMYKARRNDYLPDGHFAKSVNSVDAAPVLQFLEKNEAHLGFHEYGCYIGVAGLVLAVWGGALTFRRCWPIYAAGAFAVLVTLGTSAPIDIWTEIRRLPLYTQLQVPSRFLAAVVFALAVAAGFGFDAAAERLRRWFPSAKRAVVVALLGVLYVEMAAMGWSLFGDVFVIPPAPIEKHADFANRFNERSQTPRIMSSTVHVYLRGNSGTLKGYENLSVRTAAVRMPTDPNYLGEAYLESGSPVTITRWTMSSVTVRFEPGRADRLILNQNYYRGWKAIRRQANGFESEIDAGGTGAGLVTIPVDASDTEVEFHYVPAGFRLGAAISGAVFIFCLGGLWLTRRSWSVP